MVPAPPRLLIHLPSDRPRIFKSIREDDDADRDAAGEDVAVFELLDVGAADVEADSDAGEDDGGQVEDVREPVAPAGEEAVLFAEAALGPEIDAAFAGPLLREFGDGRALRPEEAAEGDDPEPDGDGAGGGDGRHHVEVGDGDDEEQHQVFAAEDALEAGLVSECDGFANAPASVALTVECLLTADFQIVTRGGDAGLSLLDEIARLKIAGILL